MSLCSDLFGPLTEAGVKICEGSVVHGSHQGEEDEQVRTILADLFDRVRAEKFLLLQAAMYSEDGEFTAGYSKLQNALPVKVLRPEIVNWKSELFFHYLIVFVFW